MSVDFDDLVNAPLINDVFGQPVTYSPAGGASYQINGVFDNAYRSVTTAEDGSEIASVYPALGTQLNQLSAPPQQGDQLTIQQTGKTYAVRNIKPDSHGWVLLVLNRVSN